MLVRKCCSIKLQMPSLTIRVFFLVFMGIGVHSQVTFEECPSEWEKYGDHCYRFVGYPRLQPNGASMFCQMDGAALVSVNSIQESSFITGWLEKYDGRRDTWLTSGIVTNEGVRWLGDGTTTNSFNFWINPSDTTSRKEGDTVCYGFSGVEYRWRTADIGQNSSFICEIPLTQIYKIVEENRDFDYGLEIESPDLAPKGPKFLLQPTETTILSKTTAAYLDCLAVGVPDPQYLWLKRVGTIMVPIASGPGTRFTLTGGRLTIDFPEAPDEGVYQCNATNEFGTILSTPISLSFGSMGEFSNVPTANVIGNEFDGAVLTCPSITAKPAVSYQWYKNTITSFIRPEFQVHSFISNNGNLYFSELAATDDAMYYCVVSLTTQGGTGTYIGSSRDISRTSLGFRLIVRSGGNSQFQPVIQDNFIKVYPGNPKRGRTIQLECFAYGTGPLIYRWYRIGKDMPRTASFTETRRVLTITNVQLEDSGLYKCRVDSSSTKLFNEKNYTLDVQSEPYFSYPLTDQHVDANSSLTWHCEARGRPTPTYTWYKDGQPILNTTGITIIGNTMRITNLQKDRHNGMYQCAAQNLYGITYSSAQIRVLAFAPTFTKNPVESSLSAAVGGNITIVCNPEAAPAPIYQWLRNDVDLGLIQGGSPNADYQMMFNGNLFIKNVNTGHQGTYTCRVTNNMGSASSSGILRVFSTTVISQRPRNTVVEVNSTATLQCASSSPPDIDVVYVWYFNDHLIDYTRDIEYRLESGNLFIIGAQYKHEGMYTCKVTTGMDFVSASAYVTVKGPPGEPAGVFRGDNQGLDSAVVDPSDRAVQLYWSDGQNRGSTIIAYTIEFRTNFDLNWRVHPDAKMVDVRFVQSNRYPEKRVIILRNLKPGAGHEFRVRAINSYGIGAPSLPSTIIQVQGTIPTVPPSGVSGGGGSVGDLTITWNPLPREDYNGEGLKYVVYWREQAKSITSDTKWHNVSLTPEEACHDIPDIQKGLITVCKLVTLVGSQNYYLPYEVRVGGSNVFGFGVQSDIVIVMSAEELPSATPTNVYALMYNSTALNVFWTPVINTRAITKGKLLGYRINYWRRDNETENEARYNFIQIPKGHDNINRGRVIGLSGKDWFYVNVQAYNSAGFGPKSENYLQETANFVPSLYPTEVYVYSIDGAGVRVNFRGISTKTNEEPLIGYKIQYWPSGENIRKAQEIDVGRRNDYVITNVTKSILYQLRIYGYSRGGQGKRSSPTVYFTVGAGQLAFNPETTDVMAKCSILRICMPALWLGLVLVVILH